MSTTPLMKQYLEVKSRHQDALLLYRMGDFYELFNEDAVVASKVLGLTLTSRNNPSQRDGEKKTPLAGFPYHSIEKHLPRLIRAGHKVAICEQTEDPATAKGIVRRDVVEVITRGTAINENCLEAKSNNYLAALFPEGDVFGLSLLDLSTGQFIVLNGSLEEVTGELNRQNVGELLYPENSPLPEPIESWISQDRVTATPLDDSYFQAQENLDKLRRHFKVESLEIFDCEDMPHGLNAAGANLQYALLQKKSELRHLISLEPRRFSEQMALDGATIRNLELVKPLHAEDESGTLFHLLDKTVTAMGGRTLKAWLTHPLVNKQKIEERLDAQQELMESASGAETLRALRQALRPVNDVERIVARIGSRRANARDLVGLARSLQLASQAGEALASCKAALFKQASQKLKGLGAEGDALLHQLAENPPLTVREGGMLNPEAHPALEEMLRGAREGKQWIQNLEKNIREETGIQSAKVGYNKVFGYYIEITKQNAEKAPDYFIRKQTLVNAERYITPDMKEWENKILNAESQANALEYEIFCRLRDGLAEKTAQLLEMSRVLGMLDVLASMSKVNLERRYCRPQIKQDGALKIAGGRHPVVESMTEEGKYIANDVAVDKNRRQILLITGPNMAGKSTYLRQVGLITLMAQVGFYVPAQEAHIGMVDRIFTRVGASDRLARGQSTFMVEMIETASILHNATPDSLILLDEIGRGTSTFDGLSLAWSIVEELHQNKEVAARTLFATHYHELTELPKTMKRAVNVQVAVKEVDQKVIFLRKVLEGHCDSSYGIHVAAMAGVPQKVIDRAWEILESLEKERVIPKHRIGFRPKSSHVPKEQQNLFTQPTIINPDPRYKNLYDALKKIDVNGLTPLEALNQLHRLRQEYLKEG